MAVNLRERRGFLGVQVQRALLAGWVRLLVGINRRRLDVLVTSPVVE